MIQIVAAQRRGPESMVTGNVLRDGGDGTPNDQVNRRAAGPRVKKKTRAPRVPLKQG